MKRYDSTKDTMDISEYMKVDWLAKDEALNILKEMQNEIERMTDEELFSHLVDSSETFRREIDELELSPSNSI